MPPLLILLTVAMLFSTACTTVMALKVCPNCGRNLVPYPLSTEPDCGDPGYKVRCNKGTLWLDAFNGSSYEISSINPMTQTLVIHPPGFAENKCVAADFATEGIQLDENLPFNITSANTVMIMNCSAAVLQEYIALNCSSTSVCHDYIRANPEANANCGALPFCCWFATGGTMHEYRIRVRAERCSAYQSFVNLNMSSPVSEWPTPGLEIQWLPPREPECKLPVDCDGSANSICLPDPENAGQRRCLCKPGFQWDSIHGICQGAAFAAGAIIIGLIVTIVIVLKQRKHCEREAEKAIDFNREEEDVNLVVFARKNIKEDRFMDVIDPCLKQVAGKIELETMKAVGFLAETCLNERRQNRPSMKSVEKEIESIMSVVTSEVFEGCAAALVRCGNCGRIPVPYPLSTGPNCGDQAYKIRCTAGELWFDALKGSYMIISISPLTQRIILRPPSFLAKTCISGDIGMQGIQLDDNLPFNITGSNTIMLLNCTDAMLHLQAPINCTSTSICHNYIKDNAAECMRTPLCCVFKTGGSQTAYVVRIHDGGCLAYQSFVNFDTVNPPKKWPEPGLEIEWELPQEPVCKTQLDCKNLLHSSCASDPMNVGSTRCLCKKGFTWDPINGLCRSAKCRPGKRCKKQKKLTVLICGMAATVAGVSLAIMVGILKAIDFNREGENVNLVVYMKNVMDEDRLMEVVDPVIKEGATNLELETIKALGLLAASCLDDKRQNRPSMKEVADEIEYIISIATGEIEALKAIGVTEVVLAINYQPEVVLNFLKEFEKKLDIKITCSQETEPLGTAGPLALARDKLTDGSGEPFFVLNSDVISEYPLKEMINFHKGHGGEASIAVTKVDEPSKYGVVVMDETTGKVESFVEKPKRFVGNKINAGIYLLNPSVLDRIDLRPTSIEKEVFPNIAAANKLYAMVLPGFWMDIGQPRDYITGLRFYLDSLRKKSSPELASGSHFIGNVLVDESAVIGDGCLIGPDVAIGPRCVIESGVRLSRCSIMRGVRIKKHACVSNSIIGWHSTVGRWARLENMTILGEDVHFGDEVYSNGGVVLPHKEIKSSILKPEIVM
ncbi:hypothetical protein GQ457_06G006790 [Hibiscus cannabinus]